MVDKPLVKICGLSTKESLDAAIGAGAEWVGLVSFPPSPRHVETASAAQLADHVRGRATIVSLSVNADDALLDEIVGKIRPDVLQFHGKESPERVAEVKRKYNLPVMKAIGISTLDDLENITPYIGIADHMLLDAKPPKGAVLPGGNGAVFDWDILKSLPETLPIMLSGGLNPDNVRGAVDQIHPFAVDVSSGVESAPGVKDLARIEKFVAEAKA